MKKRHSAEQTVGKLRQADVALGKGLKVPEVCRELGISEQTYYRWRQKWGDGARGGQAAQGVGEGERSVEAAGGRPGAGHSDPEGGEPPKRVSPERRRRTG